MTSVKRQTEHVFLKWVREMNSPPRNATIITLKRILGTPQAQQQFWDFILKKITHKKTLCWRELHYTFLLSELNVHCSCLFFLRKKEKKNTVSKACCSFQRWESKPNSRLLLGNEKRDYRGRREQGERRGRRWGEEEKWGEVEAAKCFNFLKQCLPLSSVITEHGCSAPFLIVPQV